MIPAIASLHARTILDSRGHPTVEVELVAGQGANTVCALASVPSGASTGKHEALELRDGGKRFLGLGVQKAIRNIERVIALRLKGIDCRQQEKIDRLMIKLDGTKNKSKLGANSILAVSLACARAAALVEGKELWQYIHKLAKVKQKPILPKPFFNVINGGKHADNELSFQEFMVVPQMKSFAENLLVASEIYHVLKQNLQQQGKSTAVGDEGGFAPRVRNAEEALNLLMKAIKDAGYAGKVDLALDCAASGFFAGKRYIVDGKKLTKEKLLEYYLKSIKKYSIISIEDPFHQDDFQGFAELRKKSGIQVVGDDLTLRMLLESRKQ